MICPHPEEYHEVTRVPRWDDSETYRFSCRLCHARTFQRVSGQELRSERVPGVARWMLRNSVEIARQQLRRGEEAVRVPSGFWGRVRAAWALLRGKVKWVNY